MDTTQLNAVQADLLSVMFALRARAAQGRGADDPVMVELIAAQYDLATEALNIIAADPALAES